MVGESGVEVYLLPVITNHIFSYLSERDYAETAGTQCGMSLGAHHTANKTD